MYVFSPCASSAYNKSSGRKTRTGSRRQGDRILASPIVLLYETPDNLRLVKCAEHAEVQPRVAERGVAARD